MIDPKNRSNMDMIKQRERWEYLGESLNHIITEEELVTLLVTELPAFQRLQEAEEGTEVDEWWAEVADVTLGGEKQFPILSRFTTLVLITILIYIIIRFALGLCTICNSSSEVERNFSDMEAMFADSRVSNMGQDLLEAKMMVKNAVKGESVNCARCIEAKEDRKKRAEAGEKLPTEKCQHCHCLFYEVDAEFLAELRDSQPSKRYHEKGDKLLKENESKKKELEEAEKMAKREEDVRIMKEVKLVRKSYDQKKKELEKEKLEKEGDGKKANDDDGKNVKKAKKRIIAIEKIDVTKKKKKKLTFLF